MDIFICKFQTFSTDVILRGFWAQTRKNVLLDFLISFRLIKDFHLPISSTLFLIKRVLNKKLSEIVTFF